MNFDRVGIVFDGVDRVSVIVDIAFDRVII